MLVVKSCVELLRSCGINNLVAVSDNPAFCLDYKLPTTLNIRTCNNDTLVLQLMFTSCTRFCRVMKGAGVLSALWLNYGSLICQI